MTVKKVLRMGDPRLLEISAPVNPINPENLRELLEDMWDTMAAENGAGLAAPQIGLMQRVVIFGCETNPRYPDAPAVPQTVLINPQISAIGDELEQGWEGCLSVPGMRGLVPRYQQIRYRGFSPDGELIEREASGFHARVVQHECDHLDGILYPMRITDMRSFGFNEELTDEGVIARSTEPGNDQA